MVQILTDGSSFAYVVNGQPEVIRGMGMNTQYARELAPGDRADKLTSDMAELQDLGVNTLVGWDPKELDETALAIAQSNGIGVVVPFQLDPDLDYTDPNVRGELTHEVDAWVQQYRSAPALRMWGLGNEALWGIVRPPWQGAPTTAQANDARAFASWLIGTADRIHALDPDHPVTYRDAENTYVPWIRDALRSAGGGPRPWFVYGANMYEDATMASELQSWPLNGTGGALWVSEFAPGDVAPAARPDGFQAMWGNIRSRQDWVLGGAVYAWTQDGPEAIDQKLGLTDNGTPVDTDSLAMISSLFGGRE